MSDYRGNQFVSEWLKPQKGEWTNAPFTYPRRVVRYSSVNPTTGEVTRKSEKLDRGFVRSLVDKTVSTITGKVSETTRQRFNFQFNPQDILQTVQMRQDIYYSINQDPAQLAQPMSAVASFAFDIFLDRTMEVANGAGRGGGTPDSPEEQRFGVRSDPFGDVKPEVDVYQYGVLSDIQVLNAIIGQGFSKQFIDDQLAQIKAQAQSEIVSDTSLDVSAQQAKLNELTNSKFDANINIGNSAFLIPMPVRVVFSELFMVDGFITSTNLQYTKFNTNMVPIQATIGISMNALYIGFARQDTFLTVNLENRIKNTQDEINALIGKREEVLSAALDSSNQFVFACDDDKDWQKGIAVGTPGTAIVIYANQQFETDYPDVEFKIGFKDAKAKGDDDKVLKLFQSGATVTMSRTWSLNVYGPYSTQSAANADKNKKAVSSNIKRVGYYVGDHTASSADEWKEMRSRSIRSDHSSTDNLSTSKLPYNSANADKYFVVNFKASLTAGDTTVPIEDWKVLKGSEVYRLDTPVNWPQTTTSSSNGSSKPYVPPARGYGRSNTTAGVY